MKKRINYFTLTEMLTVIAIIGILAAIVTPTVIIARKRGMKAEAEADITAIMTALKAMDSDWNKVLGKENKIGGEAVATEKINTTTGVAIIDGDAYNAMIAELSVPKNSGLTAVSVNKRKKTYLDARQEFDPGKSYKLQPENVWRDPYGNPYVILVQTKRNNELEINGTKTISANFAVYSTGPNGTDDHGCCVEQRICSVSNCTHDDIASWNL